MLIAAGAAVVQLRTARVVLPGPERWFDFCRRVSHRAHVTGVGFRHDRDGGPVTATPLANAAWQTDGRLRQRRLLELDPDLGGRLSLERFAAAHRRLSVWVGRVPRGLWRVDGRLAERCSLFGLLITSGVVTREVLVRDVVSTELLGAGDVVAPWTSSPEHGGAREQGRWQALATTEIALLDARLASRLGEYPEIQQALYARVFMRVDRLGALKALSDVNAVDQRLTGIFRHLALRWGRVTERGVIIPLALSHRLLAELIGARRPTVTTALKRLSRDGVVTRIADGTWLLSEQPFSDPEYDPPIGSPHRRRLLSDAALDTDPHGHPAGHRFHKDARQATRQLGPDAAEQPRRLADDRFAHRTRSPGPDGAA